MDSNCFGQKNSQVFGQDVLVGYATVYRMTPPICVYVLSTVSHGKLNKREHFGAYIGLRSMGISHQLILNVWGQKGVLRVRLSRVAIFPEVGWIFFILHALVMGNWHFHYLFMGNFSLDVWQNPLL